MFLEHLLHISCVLYKLYKETKDFSVSGKPSCKYWPVVKTRLHVKSTCVKGQNA